MAVISVLSTVAVAFGSIVFAAFQGHATASSVERYQRENDSRVLSLEIQLDEVRKQAEREREDQAFFRGAVASKLGFLLPQQQEEEIQ